MQAEAPGSSWKLLEAGCGLTFETAASTHMYFCTHGLTALCTVQWTALLSGKPVAKVPSSLLTEESPVMDMAGPWSGSTFVAVWGSAFTLHFISVSLLV